MGCGGISMNKSSVQVRIQKHIAKIFKMCQKNKTARIPNHVVEDILKRELYIIYDIVVPHQMLPTMVFYDLVCALDELYIEFPVVSVKTEGLIKTVKEAVRVRCHSIKLEDVSQKNTSNGSLQATVHILQKEVTETEATTKDDEIGLKRAKKTLSGNFGEELKDLGVPEAHPGELMKEKPLRGMTGSSDDASQDYGFYDFSVHSGGSSIHGKFPSKFIVRPPEKTDKQS
mmetsp:Transcript_39648/g.40418  ORF Transcript_39648/g.40418 Transcript_39648/m.40418 type:complete len:229 (-) Transcript_39648:68-754(-)